MAGSAKAPVVKLKLVPQLFFSLFLDKLGLHFWVCRILRIPFRKKLQYKRQTLCAQSHKWVQAMSSALAPAATQMKNIRVAMKCSAGYGCLSKHFSAKHSSMCFITRWLDICTHSRCHLPLKDTFNSSTHRLYIKPNIYIYTLVRVGGPESARALKHWIPNRLLCAGFIRPGCPATHFGVEISECAHVPMCMLLVIRYWYA